LDGHSRGKRLLELDTESMVLDPELEGMASDRGDRCDAELDRIELHLASALEKGDERQRGEAFEGSLVEVQLELQPDVGHIAGAISPVVWFRARERKRPDPDVWKIGELIEQKASAASVGHDEACQRVNVESGSAG